MSRPEQTQSLQHLHLLPGVAVDLPLSPDCPLDFTLCHHNRILNPFPQRRRVKAMRKKHFELQSSDLEGRMMAPYPELNNRLMVWRRLGMDGWMGQTKDIAPGLFDQH